MSQEPIDFEAERRRAAKELGLPYSDLEDPVHWQRNMQTQEAKKELAEMLSKNDTKTQSREPLEDESTYASSESIYTQGRTAQEEPEHTAGVAMNREHTKLSWKLRAESFVNKVKSFAASRRERSQAGGVAAQQKEKSRQIQTAAVGLTTVAAVVAGTMMLAGDDRGVRTEPVRVYKSDFRLEPEALDKQSYQKIYDEKLAGVTERLQTMEELAARLQKELAAQQEKKGTQSAASEPNTAVPVNQLPDFSPQSRAAIEAGTLSGAMNTSPPVTFDGPRLKRLAVTDPIKDFEAIRTAARERYTKRSAASIDSPIAANRARNEAAGTYLPAGSFARAVVLAGATVSTGGTASSNPVPMLLEVKDLAKLPNDFRANVKACFVTANATGDLSSERVWIRLERLSCMTTSGKALDARIQGYVTGDDGKTGVRARLVTRSGQAIASALLTGSISGLGKAVSLSAQDTTTYTSGAVGTTVSDSFRAGLGEGLESALDRIADYYIRLADKIFPCLEIDSGRKVDLILSQGLTIAVDETAPSETSGGAMPLASSEGPAVNSSELFGERMKAASERYD